MPPSSRALVHPALGSGGASGGGGGGLSGLTSGVVGALGSGGLVGPMGSPLGPVGAYSGADALYLPYRYRSCVALHNALALAPPNTVGELWGPTDLIGRAILRAQNGGPRLQFIGPINLLSTSSTGAEWDTDGVLDYQWIPAGAGSVAWTSGLTVTGGVVNLGLARPRINSMSWRAETGGVTFSGFPVAAAPRVYVGGLSEYTGHILAGAGQGYAGGVGSEWARSLLEGNPDAPTAIGAASGADSPPTAEAVYLALDSWGESQASETARLQGGWRPFLTTGGAPVAAIVTAGAGGGWCPCVGYIVGDATGPAAVSFWILEYSGDWLIA